MTSSTRTDCPQLDDGPLPGSRWLTISEYSAAHDLALKFASGMRFEGVTMWANLQSSEWRLLELLLPGKPDRRTLIGLPLVDGEWGPAQTSAFFVVVKNKQDIIVDRAKLARGSIETLLDALGWPAVVALNRAIDRCLELEEKRADANR
jgi:hypothetical protein